MNDVSTHYQAIQIIYSAASTIAWIPLVVSLYLVQTGNRQPGFQLLAIVPGVQLLIAAILALQFKWPLLVLSLAGLMPAIALGALFLRPMITWRVLPEEPDWARWLAVLGYGLAMTYPMLARGWFAPLGVLPQPALLAVLVLTSVTGTAARVPALAAIVGAALAVVVDVVHGFAPSATVLLIAATIAAWVQFRPSSTEAKALSVGPKAAGKQVTQSEKPAGPSAPKRKWDI
jgi:hypothetical protein